MILRHTLLTLTCFIACGLALAESPADLHQQALVLDAHADIEIPGKPSRYADADGSSRVSPAKMRAGQVDAVIATIAVGPGPRDAAGFLEARATADAELRAIIERTEQADDDIILARDADALLAAHRAGQITYILGLQNARIFGTDLTAIDEFYTAGVRIFALTHMGHNDFADSSRPVFIGELGRHEPDAEHGGLSPLGRDAVARLNQLGAVIDVSQLSRPATLQVLELSTAPVIASHSNVQALSDVRRNLSDKEIDAIGENGGVIHIAGFRGYLFDSNNPQLDRDIRAARIAAGIQEDYDYPYELYWEIKDEQVQQAFITAISTLLGPGHVNDMVKHINYIVQRIGIDHVGVGNDFNHGGGVAGYTNASGAPALTAALVEEGYSAAEIRKIWSENFIRVWREAARKAL